MSRRWMSTEHFSPATIPIPAEQGHASGFYRAVNMSQLVASQRTAPVPGQGSAAYIIQWLCENFRKQQDLQVLVNRLKEKFNDVKFEITSIGERLRAEFGMGVNDVINQEPNPLFQRDALEKAL